MKSIGSKNVEKTRTISIIVLNIIIVLGFLNFTKAKKVSAEDSEPREVWVKRYDGPTSDDDSAQAIAVDDSGNIYVTGDSAGIDTECDYATVKYVDGNISLGILICLYS